MTNFCQFVVIYVEFFLISKRAFKITNTMFNLRIT